MRSTQKKSPAGQLSLGVTTETYRDTVKRSNYFFFSSLNICIVIPDIRGGGNRGRMILKERTVKQEGR